MIATIEKEAVQPANPEVSGPCKMMEPTAKAPSNRQLATFTEEDRALLARVLSETLEYLDHALFAQPNAEKLLFGEKAVLNTGTTWFADSASDPADGALNSSSLQAAQEILLFQRFNYARMRMFQIVSQFQEKTLTVDAARQLLGWAHRATQARCQIVKANVPLVLEIGRAHV